MRLAIIAVGTELTEGRIANTNAAWISKRFLRLGIETTCHLAVPDVPAAMRDAFLYGAAHADLVVVTGGLGPTVDDITRDVAAELAAVPLEEDRASIDRLEMIFKALGRSVSPNNRRQAQFPRGAEIVPNDHGTAPGFRMTIAGARFAFVPGVPHESERMLDDVVIPALERELAGTSQAPPAVVIRRLNCFGLAESKVDALLAPHFPAGAGTELAFNISEGVVQVYLTARGADRAAAEARVEAGAARVRETLSAHFFGEGERSLEETVIDLCRERGLRMGFAESCTGGLAAGRIARVPGASDVLAGGIVAYSNEVKRSVLGVPPEIIEAHGAVSRETALAMARGARRVLNVHLAAAITGIAGPAGGTAEKPVGLVYIAVVNDTEERVREARLGGDRRWIQLLSSLGAIDQLRRLLLGLPAAH